MKRKNILIACSSLCCILAIILAFNTSAVAADESIPPNVSEQEIKNSLIGAIQVQLDVGRFESQNGLAPSVDSIDYQNNIYAFNQDVDLFYAMDNPCRELYKEIHEELLGGTAQNIVGYTVKNGISDCEIIEITSDEKSSDIIVDALLSEYCTWIDEESNNFKIKSPLNVERIKAKMTFEENSWKLLDTISSDMQYIDGIQNTNPENSTNMLTVDLTAKDFNMISNITEKEYDTFSEALAAAQQICME